MIWKNLFNWYFQNIYEARNVPPKQQQYPKKHSNWTEKAVTWPDTPTE